MSNYGGSRRSSYYGGGGQWTLSSTVGCDGVWQLSRGFDTWFDSELSSAIDMSFNILAVARNRSASLQSSLTFSRS